MMGDDVDVLNRYNSSIAWSDGSGVGPVRFAVKKKLYGFMEYMESNLEEWRRLR